MSSGGVVWLVVGIVAAVGAVQVAIWIPVIRWLRRRTASMAATMARDAVASGEGVVIEPEACLYRGGDAPFPSVKGNSVMMLTDRRLVCRMVAGKRTLEIPVAQIVGVREERWFKRAATGGRVHLVVSLADGREAGFYTSGNARWLAALASRAGPGTAPGSPAGAAPV